MSEIDELTQNLLRTKIAQALQDTPKYIETLIDAALQEKVTPDGDNQYSGKRIPWLQNAVNRIIREATIKAIHERVAELTPDIREQVKSRLTSEMVVDSFTNAITESAKDAWRLTVRFGKDE